MWESKGAAEEVQFVDMKLPISMADVTVSAPVPREKVRVRILCP